MDELTCGYPQMLCPPKSTDKGCVPLSATPSLTHGHPICLFQDSTVWDCHLPFPSSITTLSREASPLARTHTAPSSDHVSLPSSWAASLLLLRQRYSVEPSLLPVPTFSPSRSLNSLPSEVYTPNPPISLTYKRTPIVCPAMF